MTSVSVCIGSSCHLKGSYEVIQLFKEEIKKRRLEDKIELKGAFCLGDCGHDGVCIKVGDKVVHGVTTENFQDVFAKEVLSQLS